ncbi:hypothetical protein [Bradyrhizobium sp.]|uniref:hypothetical protein n=1 Tax=Bradyrhizobium sp. TaxID=376 RepID=UPI001D9E652D|nr:hypothetical protein [Bradyrhizobium sp.]MBI5317975.1 hypothetical protein [Bradyrhizobium sp.]
MCTPLRLALAVLALLASADAALAQAEIDKARATAFDRRLFAGPLAPKTTYACFVRTYDAEHLAKHPKQKVAAMKLLVTAEHPPDEKITNYSFRLGVKFRHRSGNFDSSGSCSHFIPEDAGDEIRLGCGVDCDGGGLSVAVARDDNSAVIRLERVRIWQNNKPDDEAEHSLVAGADDKMFRLDRTDTRECASLVTDRQELAAIRRK